ncbi:MAG: transposase [Candidatus Eisenbacteria sp.]|nr:transposase [Candidatus Eisenbacteria bacterium]
MICKIYRLSRSTLYAQRKRDGTADVVSLKKRGPQTRWSDAEILFGIRQVLAASSFHGEGHRKVRVRLRPHGMRVGKNRVLRIMRENGLLVPTRWRANHG